MIVFIQGQAIDTWIDTEGLAHRDARLVAKTGFNLVIVVAAGALSFPLGLDVFLDVVVAVLIVLVFIIEFIIVLSEFRAKDFAILFATRSWDGFALVALRSLDFDLETIPLFIVKVI